MSKKPIRYDLIAKRVLLEVGRPLDANVLRFARCLEVCVQWYGDARIYHRRSASQEFAELTGEIANTAGYLLTLLADPRTQRLTTLRSEKRLLVEQLQAILPKVERLRSIGPNLVPVTGDEADLVEGMRYEDHFKQRSPFEWIAGVYIPELFFLFVDNTRVGRKWGKGPEFLSFAAAVLSALKIQRDGMEYSRETIAKAVRLNPTAANKHGLLRRKNGPAFDAEVNDPWEWYRHQAWAVACGCSVKTSIETVARVIRVRSQSGQKFSKA